MQEGALYAVTDFPMIAFQNHFPGCHTSLRYERPYLLNISALTEHYKLKQSLLLLLIKNSRSLISPSAGGAGASFRCRVMGDGCVFVFADCERRQTCERLPLHHGKFGEWNCFPFFFLLLVLSFCTFPQLAFLLLFRPSSPCGFPNLFPFQDVKSNSYSGLQHRWQNRTGLGLAHEGEQGDECLQNPFLSKASLNISLPLSLVHHNRVLRTSIWSVLCMVGQTWQAFSWWTSAILWWLNSCSAGTSWTRESIPAQTSLPR